MFSRFRTFSRVFARSAVSGLRAAVRHNGLRTVTVLSTAGFTLDNLDTPSFMKLPDRNEIFPARDYGKDIELRVIRVPSISCQNCIDKIAKHIREHKQVVGFTPLIDQKVIAFIVHKDCSDADLIRSLNEIQFAAVSCKEDELEEVIKTIKEKELSVNINDISFFALTTPCLPCVDPLVFVDECKYIGWDFQCCMNNAVSGDINTFAKFEDGVRMCSTEESAVRKCIEQNYIPSEEALEAQHEVHKILLEKSKTDPKAAEMIKLFQHKQ